MSANEQYATVHRALRADGRRAYRLLRAQRQVAAVTKYRRAPWYHPARPGTREVLVDGDRRALPLPMR